MSTLEDLSLSQTSGDFEVAWSPQGFNLIAPGSQSKVLRRRALGIVYRELSLKIPSLRAVFDATALDKKTTLPAVMGEDKFLRMYAEGEPLTLDLLRALLRTKSVSNKPPVTVGERPDCHLYHDVKAISSEFLAKLSSKRRKKSDERLLEHVQSDLNNICQIEDFSLRRWLTLALLSHGAIYRHLEGKVLKIPSLVSTERKLIPYSFHEHLIWEGVKTASASPLEREGEEIGIYLCQGTEIWPSQPLMLGTIFANLGIQGAATEPYAYAWRQIHKHLRALAIKGGQKPIVAGHSMGGALAAQMALYSHPLISKAYAFNPPVVERRDYEIYQNLSAEIQDKLEVYANVDDIAFWRIGSKVIGKVTLLLGEKRWKYRPIKRVDRYLILPALIKTCLNLCRIVPPHQDIVPLMRSYLMVPLSKEEIEKENNERAVRDDHIRFFPKLYKPLRFLLTFSRANLTWEKRIDYLKSQIEILELHEEDLRETLLFTTSDSLLKELEQLSAQKAALQEELRKLQ